MKTTNRSDRTSGPEFLTTEQAAERVGLSARQVRRLIAERRIGFYRAGRSVRIDPAEIIDYMLAGRVEPITETYVREHL
ncbi:helix-turn-helix domain-containing protein [Kineosporia sp. J2-2]|uniref:Helix-turn-helix domain-containing protein n=1 Tax=Kineosporia corallincola TaxID=2835133 RepID=A0ABS5TK30_9ACTN|nr:helix-turn-helix domain-containing protein [Kineosporia corallincola]MBT0771370.1 helix-turn-helix domain-containing protein [Kineosporia corallincola]